MRKPKSAYLIRSVGRALDLLEAFTEHDGSLGLTDLAKRLGIHKNNAFRLLATLETRGYVTQEPGTGRYRLGLKLYQLGQHVQRLLSPAREARPILEGLVRHCDETAYLGILDDASVVYVAMVETTQAIRVAPRLGARAPAWLTAHGKIQLAFLPPERLDEAIQESPVTDPDELRRRLAESAQRGYDVEDEDPKAGVRGLAAPVRDEEGQVMASLGLVGPTFRLTPDRIERELSPLVSQAARELSARLGAPS